MLDSVHNTPNLDLSVKLSLFCCFVLEMYENGIWAGSAEITALARLFQITILVYDTAHEGRVGRWSVYPFHGCYNSRPMIVLYHQDDIHFQVVERASKEAIVLR